MKKKHVKFVVGVLTLAVSVYAAEYAGLLGPIIQALATALGV